MKTYHAIFIGGNKWLQGGVPIAGYRLRTSVQKYGYDMLVLDSAVVMSQEQLLKILTQVVGEDTLVIGISTVWLDGYNMNSIEWLTDSFLTEIKERFPSVKLVAGGPAESFVVGSAKIKRHADWLVTGFSDDSFPKLLNYLSGKKDHGLKYFVENSKRIIDSNTMHIVKNPDDVETVFAKSDNFLPHQPLPLEVSRGCIFRCSFCNHPFQGAKNADDYIRTPESLATELKRNYELFGTTRYTILDDTFNDSMEKLDRLHRAIDISGIPDFKFVSYIKPELLVTKPEMIDKLIALGFAGGHVGVESINDKARKVMRKGMSIDKVNDAIRLLNQKSKSKINATFIVGLPDDSIENMYKTHDFLVETQHELYSSWRFFPLGLFYDKDLNGLSELDKDPEKFGYTILSKKPDSIALWKNEHMTMDQAVACANDLNAKAEDYNLVSGWWLATSWYLNIPEIELSKTMRELTLFTAAKRYLIDRATEVTKYFDEQGNSNDSA